MNDAAHFFIRGGENGMQGGDNRFPESFQQEKQVRAVFPPEDAEFMLNIDELHLFHPVELVGGIDVVFFARLAYLKNHFFGIGEVARLAQIHRDDL